MLRTINYLSAHLTRLYRDSVVVVRGAEEVAVENEEITEVAVKVVTKLGPCGTAATVGGTVAGPVGIIVGGIIGWVVGEVFKKAILGDD